MVVFENLLIIFISVIYALSLYCIVELTFKINEIVKRSVELVLAMACLTSIDFISDALGALKYVKYSSYILMILILYGMPLIVKFKKRQSQTEDNKTEQFNYSVVSYYKYIKHQLTKSWCFMLLCF